MTDTITSEPANEILREIVARFYRVTADAETCCAGLPWCTYCSIDVGDGAIYHHGQQGHPTKDMTVYLASTQDNLDATPTPVTYRAEVDHHDFGDAQQLYAMIETLSLALQAGGELV